MKFYTSDNDAERKINEATTATFNSCRYEMNLRVHTELIVKLQLSNGTREVLETSREMSREIRRNMI